MSPAPASPCVGVCRLDEHRGLCTGCLRTLDEITQWPTASPDQQARILARVAARTGAPAATPPASPPPEDWPA